MENVITNNSFLRLALEEIIIFTSAELKEKKIAIIDIDINDTYGVNLSSIKSADKCIILCAKKYFYSWDYLLNALMEMYFGLIKMIL